MRSRQGTGRKKNSHHDKTRVVAADKVPGYADHTGSDGDADIEACADDPEAQTNMPEGRMRAGSENTATGMRAAAFAEDDGENVYIELHLRDKNVDNSQGGRSRR